MLRIQEATPLGDHRLRLRLTDGSTVERDIGPLLAGPVFDVIRNDPKLFTQVRVRHGSLWWPGDIDLCPDVVLGNVPQRA
ncbi:MAG TPA: DUF2442 domain-containing protein [Pirellulales bacterium]|jgi:hypothetical protein|nr:DUF2442 domain-containing protein [Pirellulales bacterium]